MGDRNNPIKFGPEWLRNLSREGNTAGTSGNNSQNAMSPNSANSGATASSSGSGNTASGSSSSHAHTSNVSNSSPKVQLAKLRYGREEMLALYDRNAEAPPELKFIELLYQPRGKAPFALNNAFEDEMQRERGGPPGPPGTNSPGDRFGMSRGMGRCLSVSDGRGRPRVPFVRSPSTGRGSSWHPTNPKSPGYSGGPEDDAPSNIRSSWAANNGAGTANRNSGEQPEWTPNKVFRSKRQGQVNWRQSREEGEEWRSPQEAGRLRSNQQEKWERDWGDRPPQDRQSQSWNSNRRTWVGGDAQNEENLPEWAVENAEAGGGTFDSSGAFHGYSNDDTNLPKTPESAYPLTRSHTHGSFVRSKTIEEGSEEWWASEKAKKLSPKRFDASDVKFKKQMSAPESNNDTGAEQKPSTSKDDNQLQEVPEKLEKSSAASEPPENATGSYCDDEKFNKKNAYKPKFPSENKTFDSHMRSDMNHEEASDGQHERGGNFQSVMIPPNNSLRLKHQNIVAAAAEVTRDIIARDKQVILKLLQNAPTSQAIENEMRKQQQATEDKIVDEIFDMTLEDKELLSKTKPISSPINQSSGNMSASMSSLVNSMAQVPNPGMQQMRLASPHYSNQGLSLNTKQNMQNPGMQGMPSGMQGMPSGMQAMQMQGLQMGLPPTLQQVAGMQALSMQVNMQQAAGNQQQGMKGAMQSSGMQSGGMPGNMQAGMQNSGMQGPMQSSLQSVGITNAALNASLGLPIGPVSNSMGLPLQGVPPPVLSNSGMNPGIAGPGMQGLGPGGLQTSGTGMPGFPSGSLLGMSSANVVNSSLFMGQNSNASMNTGDIPMPNHGGQNNMYSMHGLQHSGSQAAFGSSIYSNMMQQPPSQPPPNPQNLSDQWYYEDPEKNIQGPFSSNEMYKWYRAGFFSPSLMVRRAVDNHMRPLGSYGPVVPFLQMDVMAAFPMPGAFERTPGPHESMMNAQQALGLESKSRFQVDSLWSQPPPTNDLMWAQQAMGARNDARVNNLPMFFWDQQPSTIASNTLLPEDITKEMKTEDQILAQLRASQGISAPQNKPFINEQAAATQPPPKQEEPFSSTPSAIPNLEELQKLIQADTLAAQHSSETNAENSEEQPKPGKPNKNEQSNETKVPQTKTVAEPKPSKSSKIENEKATKNKENSSTKSKNKKKDEKKEELESKIKEEDIVKTERRSEETSPSKSKKEDKNNKKDLEKEKKEWLKDGFTIVKGSEKNAGKDNKKKLEETKVAEEIERRRKEIERLAAEEDRKRKHVETIRKQEMQQQQLQQRQAAESVVKRAPWSAVGNQGMMATTKEGLTLAEIQRLEREKKLEQIKEQQHMMQLIAQQQAAALAREQEVQAGLGWAKKKGLNNPGQSLAEIQAEARKQAAMAAAAVAAAAAVQSFDEVASQPPINHAPWGNGPNGGFWDTQPNQPSKAEKPHDSPKAGVSEPKPKKKVSVVTMPAKKETTPAIEFETWCTTVLASWSSKIDVPTFVGFLKDIESPYEVKDYVKCYLGESKDTSDFARNFLERRSKLLRVGMVTPSDDLCSPAMAVNPRTISGSDYQEGKGKKTKKNKMLKVDARILGFSVTAAEDRINVGDIDSV